MCKWCTSFFLISTLTWLELIKVLYLSYKLCFSPTQAYCEKNHFLTAVQNSVCQKFLPANSKYQYNIKCIILKYFIWCSQMSYHQVMLFPVKFNVRCWPSVVGDHLFWCIMQLHWWMVNWVTVADHMFTHDLDVIGQVMASHLGL